MAAKKAKKAAAKKAPAKKAAKKAAAPTTNADAAEITAHIRDLGDWRGETLAKIRKLLHDAEPDVVEELKWRKPTNPTGVPVWSHNGILCTGETYQDKIKLTFAKGAALPDPAHLFNASLDAGTRRAIDIPKGHKLDEKAFKTLIRSAVALNAYANAR